MAINDHNTVQVNGMPIYYKVPNYLVWGIHGGGPEATCLIDMTLVEKAYGCQEERITCDFLMKDATEDRVRDFVVAFTSTAEGLKTLQNKKEAGDKILAEIEEDNKERRAEEQKQLAEMKAKGFKYHTQYWVHPKGGGDDECYDLFTVKKPTKSEMAKYLKDSAIKDDYQTREL